MPDLEFRLEPPDNDRLANLCGKFDEHLKQIEERLHVEVSNRGENFRVSGPPENVASAKKLLAHLYEVTTNESLSPEQIHLYLQDAGMHDLKNEKPEAENSKSATRIATRKHTITCRGERQVRYVESIREHDLSFGIGPAGTGKTYLAVAAAVELVDADMVQRLVLVRPAVEAGERLGFLPGDLMQKVDPYLRPIYDALYEFMGIDRVGKLVERNVIEIAPLAYMRGRTLNHSCVIMDEAQNTTVEQMKMFLTRIGFGSKAIVTGDTTQIDLPKNTLSGLKHVQNVLTDVEGIGFCHFKSADVVRHPLVQRIVTAYESAEASSDAARAAGTRANTKSS